MRIQPSREAPGAVPGRSSRLLIVDGDAPRRRLLACALGAEGYELFEARSAADALALGGADAVVVAGRLPDGEALELLRRLKADPASAATPVLWITPPDGEGERVRALDGGADVCLAEPFAPEALRAQVRALLRARETQTSPKRRGRADEAPRDDDRILSAQLKLSLEAVRGCAWELNLTTGALRFTVSPRRFLRVPAGGEVRSTLESWLERIHPEDRRRTESRLARALHRTGVYQSEHRVRREDGIWRWVRDRGTVERDGRGNPARLVGVTVDVSQRVAAGDRAERRRRESEDRLRVALTSASLGAYDCDPRAQRVWFDERARKILEVGPGAATGLEAFLARLHPEDRDRIRAGLTGRRPPDAPIEGFTEFRLVPEVDGKSRWIRASWRTLLQGEEAIRYLGTVEDITQARRARTAAAFLDRVGKALISSRAYDETLQRIVEVAVPSLGDWAAIDLLDGEYLRRVALWHKEDGARRFAREAFARWPIHVESSTGLGTVVRDGRSRLVPHLAPGQLEAQGREPEHRAFLKWLGLCSILAVPLHFQGRTLGVLSFSFAESKRHHGEEDLALAEALAERAAIALDNARMFEEATRDRERAEEANRAKDEFLAVVSHELRTPLTSILGYCGMMRLGKLSEPRRAHAFEVIDRNARAQAQLVEDLLDISRIVSGKLRLELRETDPLEVLHAALEAVRPAAQAKGIRLMIDTHQAEPLLADPDRLQQVMWNLLANAIKFTPSSGWVSVRLRQDAFTLTLTVEDTGQGIATDFLPFVFDRFRQADSSSKRAHGGLGLGLAITRHLVELHGGTIDVASEGAGKGARFTVRVPVRMPLLPEAAETQAAKEASQPSRSLEGVRVLVVDDEADTREMVGTLLADESASVRLAGGVKEAIALLEEEPVDLLISDLAMPGEDGFALIAHLRERSRGSQVPAIALTGHGRSEVRAEVMRAGFDLHLSKPIDPEELLRVVARLLRTGPAR